MLLHNSKEGVKGEFIVFNSMQEKKEKEEQTFLILKAFRKSIHELSSQVKTIQRHSFPETKHGSFLLVLLELRPPKHKKV